MYQNNIQLAQETLNKLDIKKKILSVSRLFLVLAATYMFYLMVYQRNWSIGLWIILVMLIFIVSLNYYSKVSAKHEYYQVLKDINEEELAFLKGKHKFQDGEEFLDPKHAFSYDLDLFGKGSVFEFINRTGTFLGKKQLALDLQQLPNKSKIRQRQEAVKELAEKLEFRQQFLALARLAEVSQSKDTAIKKWTETTSKSPGIIFTIVAILIPFFFLISLIVLVLDLHAMAMQWTVFLFTLNLMMSGIMMKFISYEIGRSDKISDILQQYSRMMQLFESQNFQSTELQALQNSLIIDNKTATKVMSQLAVLLERLNTVANLFVFIFFNGTFQYHFWVHRKLLYWKHKNQGYMWQWIEVIGKVESLNSLANFAYNNPDYQYPTVSDSEFYFKKLGHPLIDKNKRIRNDIDFSNRSFFILTGSNMSGKSTFLRTVGISLVLCYVGAPIDVVEASISPLPLWVSMRLTDSLLEDESYFFAEVKRLKRIVTEAENQVVFVLLDEILKGTNSDDKKSGTIGVIKRLNEFDVKGIIATHDLEVCEVTKDYPSAMCNIRFEAEIINDELRFDYLLKEGICQNKNATFIMEKMGVI